MNRFKLHVTKMMNTFSTAIKLYFNYIFSFYFMDLYFRKSNYQFLEAVVINFHISRNEFVAWNRSIDGNIFMKIEHI